MTSNTMLSLLLPITQNVSVKRGKRPKRLLSSELVAKLRDRMDDCGVLKFRRKCDNIGVCGHEWRGKSSLCNLNYCDCPSCREYRRKKKFFRLLRLNIKSDVMVHQVVGSPKISHRPTRQDILNFKQILNRFEQNVRRLKVKVDVPVSAKHPRGVKSLPKYSFRFIRCLDIEVTKTYNHDIQQFEFFLHAHYAVLPENGLWTCASDFNDCVQRASKGVIRVVAQLGSSRTHSLLEYIAKRSSGVMGHDADKGFGKIGEEYGYSTFMTLGEYTLEYHGVKMLSISGFKYQLTSHEVQVKEYLRKFSEETEPCDIGKGEHGNIRKPRALLRHVLALAISSNIRITTQNYCPKCGSFNIRSMLYEWDKVPPDKRLSLSKMSYDDFVDYISYSDVPHLEQFNRLEKKVNKELVTLAD